MGATYYVGDAIQVMNRLPERSVDLILTSPPFLALRSYLPADHPDKHLEGGSQATPGAFIDWLIDVVEACDRVLAPHGSMCIELGDTYAGSGDSGGGTPPTWGDDKWGDTAQSNRTSGSGKGEGWPLAKSLSLIPELFRLTLVYGFNPLTGRTTERWRLRNVIRWVRPNPPVGALGDKFRPATSELMVFCKSAKRFFDLDAVREPYSAGTLERGISTRPDGNKTNAESRGGGWSTLRSVDLRNSEHAGAPPLDWWNIPPGGYEGAHYAVWPPELCVKPIKAMCPEKVCRTCGEPSRRIVATQPELNGQRSLADEITARRSQAGVSRADMVAWFPHYKNGESVMAQVSNWELAKNVPSPDDWEILKERLGVSDTFDELVNSERRWTESTVNYLTDNGQALAPNERRTGGIGYDRGGGPPADANRVKASRQAPERFTDCGHDDWRPGLVLDCFAGSGTTGAVATGHGRDAFLIDLDERNFALAVDRIGPMFIDGPYFVDAIVGEET